MKIQYKLIPEFFRVSFLSSGDPEVYPSIFFKFLLEISDGRV